MWPLRMVVIAMDLCLYFEYLYVQIPLLSDQPILEMNDYMFVDVWKCVLCIAAAVVITVVE